MFRLFLARSKYLVKVRKIQSVLSVSRMKILFEFDNHCSMFEYVEIFKLGISLPGIAWATENGENCGHLFIQLHRAVGRSENPGVPVVIRRA